MGYNVKLGKYRHFKGNEYEVIGIAKHSETAEEMVVYKALYGNQGLWVRPVSMWNEVVERDGIRCKRFTYIEDEASDAQTWIIPCNLKNYDVHGAFSNMNIIDWKQSVTNIEVGDIIFIYVSRPEMRLAYKCKVLQTNVEGRLIDDSKYVLDGTPYIGYDRHMRLLMLEKVETDKVKLEALKSIGLKGNIQGPRRVDGKLREYIYRSLQE